MEKKSMFKKLNSWFWGLDPETIIFLKWLGWTLLLATIVGLTAGVITLAILQAN